MDPVNSLKGKYLFLYKKYIYIYLFFHIILKINIIKYINFYSSKGIIFVFFKIDIFTILLILLIFL